MIWSVVTENVSALRRLSIVHENEAAWKWNWLLRVGSTEILFRGFYCVLRTWKWNFRNRASDFWAHALLYMYSLLISFTIKFILITGLHENGGQFRAIFMRMKMAKPISIFYALKSHYRTRVQKWNRKWKWKVSFSFSFSCIIESSLSFMFIPNLRKRKSKPLKS